MFLRVNGCLSMLLGFRHEEASEMAIKKEDVESFIKLDRNDEYKTGLLLKDGRSIYITEDYNSFIAKMNQAWK